MDTCSLEVCTRSSHGNGIPMGFPREWELDLNKDVNGNATTWEWERLMLA